MFLKIEVLVFLRDFYENIVHYDAFFSLQKSGKKNSLMHEILDSSQEYIPKSWKKVKVKLFGPSIEFKLPALVAL